MRRPLRIALWSLLPLLLLAALLAVPAIDRAGHGRWVRRSLITHAVVTPLICVVYFSPTFSTGLLFLGFPWAVTAPLFMLMVALHVGQHEGPDHTPRATP